MESKYCRDCGADRPIAEFTHNRNSRDGYAFYCREHARRRHCRSRDTRNGTRTRRHPRDLFVPEGYKWCPDCGQVLPFSAYGLNAASKTGRATYCKPCHNARGKLAKELVGGERTYHLRRRYGITAEDADAMLDAQGGLCAICKAAPAVHVDHDHETGAVRALLCFNCNGGLGQFKDDPAVLRSAAEYVSFHTLSQQLIVACAATGIGPVRPIRPGTPPVGSDRRPGGRGTTPRSTGRTSRSRRQTQAGEADG
jgi:Recombination endonuclease VII